MDNFDRKPNFNFPSLQNSLQLALKTLGRLPSHVVKEIIYVNSTNISSDPGDIYRTIDPTLENFSFECDNCKENLSQTKPKQLKIINTIIDHVRNLISKYYDGKKVCEDELCKYQTTIFDLMQFSNLCPVCKKSMLAPVLSQKDIHEQIVFTINLL